MATNEALEKLISGAVDVEQYLMLLERALDIQKGVNNADVIISDQTIVEQLGLIARHTADLLSEFHESLKEDGTNIPLANCPMCGNVLQGALW